MISTQKWQQRIEEMIPKGGDGFGSARPTLMRLGSALVVGFGEAVSLGGSVLFFWFYWVLPGFTGFYFYPRNRREARPGFAGGMRRGPRGLSRSVETGPG